MKFFAMFIIFFAFYNCKSPDIKSQNKLTDVAISDTILPQSKYDSLAVKNNEILPFSSKVKKITAYANKIEGQKFNLFFDVTTQTKAFVKISTDKPTDNIRIDQIINPNQESDGPFGKEIEFPLYQGGMYEIVLAESLMQGSPFQGNFKVEIELK